MRRRDLFALPATALFSPRPPARVATGFRIVSMVLDQADPYAQLDRLWRYGVPVRVMARPHPAWWRSRVELPDRWQAWVETRDGAAVHILCSPSGRKTCEGARPPDASSVGRVSTLVAEALKSA